MVEKGKQETQTNRKQRREVCLETGISSVTRYTSYQMLLGSLPPDPIHIEVIKGERRSDSLGEDRPVQVSQLLMHENPMRVAESRKQHHVLYICVW